MKFIIEKNKEKIESLCGRRWFEQNISSTHVAAACMKMWNEKAEIRISIKKKWKSEEEKKKYEEMYELYNKFAFTKNYNNLYYYSNHQKKQQTRENLNTNNKGKQFVTNCTN